MQTFTVTKKEAGWRFDKYLKKLLPQAGNGFLYKMLRKKNITLNGKKAAGNESVADGDSVVLFFSEETFRKFSGGSSEGAASGEFSGNASANHVPRKAVEIQPARNMPDIGVIYEDEDILILNKPVGILSQKSEKGDVSLNEWMLRYLDAKGELDAVGSFRPSVCNRLDRNTSGVVLCGKSVRGSQFLSAALRERSLRKYYAAYVKGKIAHDMTLISYFRKDEEKNRAQILSERAYGRLVKERPEMEREYKLVEMEVNPLSYQEEEDSTKLEIRLVSGKSHQIRAQLAATSHPVLGDRKYGWKPRTQREEGWKYQMLHACRVEFPEEIEGEFAYLSGKKFEAPAPIEWRGL